MQPPQISVEFESAIKTALRAEYQRGKEDGLAIAKQIRNWLTRQPDRKWQQEVRACADAAIERAERDET